MQLSEQEIIRRQAKEELEKLGIDPYPAELFEVNASAAEILENYERHKSDYRQISIAGRIMSRRIMGSASFIKLQDQTGRIQVYFRRDDLCPGEDKTLYNTVFKKLLDIGDIIGVKGYVFTTQTGEISIHVTTLTVLSKALRPLPVVKETTDEQGNVVRHDAFTDPEQRYRMRYVDLVVNPQVRDAFIKRTQLVNSMRQYLNAKAYLEVETPILQPLYGGAAARPFKTHHNALDMTLYLRIANELYLKRLLVGGFERVFEFAKDFRNEGIDRSHNPEFTMMECYAAYLDYMDYMDMVEEMFKTIATALDPAGVFKFGETSLDFMKPWKRIRFFDAIKEKTGLDLYAKSETELVALAKKAGVHVEAGLPAAQIIDEVFSATVEPGLQEPTFIYDYPKELSPLAKDHRSLPGLVERFEGYVAGMEVCNAFSELNDPLEQRRRFEAQGELRERGDEEAQQLDEDYIRALEYGMPPAAGLGIGIDRLTMVFTDSHSIRDVIFFPHMRPEEGR